MQATETKLNTEHNRFMALHVDFEDPDQLFNQLTEVAGLERVQQYNDKLDTIFNLSKLGLRKQVQVTLQWNYFIDANEYLFLNLERLKKTLGLTHEDDENKIETLIRCAHFCRFPKVDASQLTAAAMLAQLAEGSIASANKVILKDQHIQWSTDIVQQGFRAEYQRHDLIVAPSLETLRQFADQWKPTQFMAPYTSIVGPTMSGKTRLLIELAKHVCVVYICLRPPESTGQPPRSKLAHEFLPPVDWKEDITEHYSCLLAAILNTVSEFFSRPDIYAKSLENRLTAWFEYSFQIDDTPKAEFNTNVQKEMVKICTEGPKPLKCLRDAAIKVCNSLSFQPDGRLKVLLAIDEASNLINPIDKKLQISYFRAFRRVLSHIPSETGFFSVFTDTTSRVANFSPSLDRDPSARQAGVGRELFTPIFKISTLDLFLPPAPSSWDELLSPARLYSYGSPFYGLYFKDAIKENMYTAVQTIAAIAEAKLLCKAKTPLPQEMTSPQCFALLGSLIQTRLSLHSPINSELVSSHAAHCLFIDPAREIVVSEYPPQFVYASAANAFLASNDACWTKCINVLASAVQKGLVALGDAGEMATRMILIRAMQKTKPIPCSKPDSTLVPHGYSVRLIDFLQTLSGEDPHTMQFGCMDEINQKRLLDEGRIFFNHFARIHYTPNATDFLEFLYRGLGVQCKRRQPGLDELFTIYLSPPTCKSEQLDPKNITFCGVQTKNQVGSVEWRDSFKWSKTYANIQGIDNPYLILLFSLRANPRSSKVPKWTNPTNSSDTQRVSYQFLGLDQIACLTPEIRSALGRLMTAIPEDLLQLHENCDQVTEDWVKQLSPVFYERSNQSSHDQTFSQAPHQQTSPSPAPSQPASKRHRL